MALLDSEIQRIKAELGYHVLSVSAEPYIGYESIFDVVIQPYVMAGAKTTSTTTVAIDAAPQQKTITLASSDGFEALQRIVIDVDDRQEVVTAQSLSGANLTALLSNAHTGTYPVTVEGGESIIREILAAIRRVKVSLGSSEGEGSLKKVDEIEFYNSNGSTFGNLGIQLSFWRDQLAAALGIESLWGAKNAAAQTLSVY